MADKKGRITLMMDPDLKRTIDYLSIDRGDRYPCDTLEYLVNLGLEKLAEITGQQEIPSGRSPRLAETGASYKVSNGAKKVQS